MAEFIDEKTRNEVVTILQKLSDRVQLVFFTKKKQCPLCQKQQELLKAVASLSDRLELQVYDIEKKRTDAESYNIEKVPATAVIGKKDYGIRFYGLTGGHEFTSLIHAIMMVGTGGSGLHPELEKLIKRIDKPVHIEVMVTLTFVPIVLKRCTQHNSWQWRMTISRQIWLIARNFLM